MDGTGIRNFVAVDARRRATAFAKAALANGAVTDDDPDYVEALGGDREAHRRLLRRVEGHREPSMSTQRDLHVQAIEHLVAIEVIIDQLKELGPDRLDGNNAIMNIRERLDALARR